MQSKAIVFIFLFLLLTVGVVWGLAAFVCPVAKPLHWLPGAKQGCDATTTTPTTTITTAATLPPMTPPPKDSITVNNMAGNGNVGSCRDICAGDYMKGVSSQRPNWKGARCVNAHQTAAGNVWKPCKQVPVDFGASCECAVDDMYSTLTTVAGAYNQQVITGSSKSGSNYGYADAFTEASSWDNLTLKGGPF